MAIVTLLTDSGTRDHYVAAIRARIIGINPGLRIEDLSHQIRLADIAHGAFVLRQIFRDFPKGTVHLVGVDATGSREDAHVAIQVEDHFFVGCDNGLFGLITDKNPQQMAQLNTINPITTTFAERDILAPAAAKLASGINITTLGPPMTQFKRLMDRQVKATRKGITGVVIHVDGTGNLITNIPKEAFDVLSQDQVFTLQFGGEKFRRIQPGYAYAERGECFVLFNSAGLLEIGIYHGNAHELLGMGYDSQVTITFETA